tara:strand:+ start:686 stop:985 length:300 start_codon:yes stop_codon:yes gene_type:complete
MVRYNQVDGKLVEMTAEEEAARLAEIEDFKAGESQRCFDQLRRDRNQKLAACDWTALSDCALSDDKKAEWVAYRKKLRDLPASYNNSTVLEVTWPSEPS